MYKFIMKDYYLGKIARIFAYIERDMPNRDKNARKLMEELKQERIDKNMPSPRFPVLISRLMKQLPPANVEQEVEQNIEPDD